MSNLNNILACLSNQICLIPIPLGTKAPVHAGWQDPSKAFRAPGQLNGTRVDQWNWGIHHTLSGTMAMDIDNVDEARWFFMRHRIDLDLLLQTHLGIHSGNPNHAKLVFRLPPWSGPLPSKQLYYQDATGKKQAMVDFRCSTWDLTGTKQDVLPGSLHPSGQYYKWVNDRGLGPGALQEIPPELYSLWANVLTEGKEQRVTVSPESTEDRPDMSDDLIRDALSHLDADCERDQWIKIGMSIHDALGEQGYSLFDEWSSDAVKYAGPHDTRTVWRSFHQQPHGITYRTLWNLAIRNGWKGHLPSFEPVRTLDDKDVVEALKQRYRDLGTVSDTDLSQMQEVQKIIYESLRLKNPEHRNSILSMIRKDLGWSKRRMNENIKFLRREARELTSVLPGVISFPFSNEEGIPRDHSANLRAICENRGIVIRHNRMTHDIEIFDPAVPSWLEDEQGNIQRNHIRDLCVEHRMPHGRANEHINTLGSRNSYHPMAEYLEKLTWDGQDWFSLVAGTVQVTDTNLWRLTLYKWALSVCASVREMTGNRPPRGVLVLTGEQLVGKTSWFRYLTPSKRWFGEGLSLDPNDKDKLKIATKYAIVELGELDSTFKKADLSKLKAHLSSPYDEVRLPYAHTESRWPRRTIYCGTVNDPEFLADKTGNTRFWVSEVDSIDLDTIEILNKNGDIGQFWAQMNAALDKGERWWLERGEARRIETSNENYREIDIFEELLLAAYAWPEEGMGAWAQGDVGDSPRGVQMVNAMRITEVAQSIGINLGNGNAQGAKNLKAALSRLTGQRRATMTRAHKRDPITGKHSPQSQVGRWYAMPFPQTESPMAQNVVPRLTVQEE